MNERKLKYDILKELFNISVGKAASLLSEIINRKILLDVPDIKILNIKNKELNLDDYLPKVIDGTLMASSISFEKKLTGKANLIFPAEKMRTFINLCLNEKETDKYYEMNFTDIDFDTIKEIGNIILNSIVGEVGNYLDISLNYTLPEVKIFNKIDFTKDIENNEYTYILILYITFIIDDTEIEGAVLVDLTFKSLTELMKKIAKIEDDLCE
ncbi:chemotaxis protein CheC [Clostridium algifaecis]|uniref:Chemotaxis protein CheC n=1 Tax=Clostridium algifaecis TaxID=1472040 RepID=A0ABS4KPW3_9CLOT|nr:chemotaxis protein CheC [Clostridium algifaecis]MBP2032087.1 chemotaxis protein CheC [Clostridium algifaecis]